MSGIAIVLLWMAWTFSTLVDHIREFGLKENPEFAERRKKKRAEK